MKRLARHCWLRLRRHRWEFAYRCLDRGNGVWDCKEVCTECGAPRWRLYREE